MNNGERRVLVLGASEGNIGQEILERAKVFSGVRVEGYGLENFDITSSTSRLSAVISRFEPTHTVYSVGINRMNRLTDISEYDLFDVMAVNVGGFIHLMQYLLLHRTGGSVVAITSDAAWRPMRTSLLYCASKAALEMAVKVASRELAGQGWRINAVAPGKVEDTPMTRAVDQRVLELRGWTEEYADKYELASSPIGRPVTKAEVAEVTLSVLFGPAAQTGQVIAVNGGR